MALLSELGKVILHSSILITDGTSNRPLFSGKAQGKDFQAKQQKQSHSASSRVLVTAAAQSQQPAAESLCFFTRRKDMTIILFHRYKKNK